MSGGIGSSNHVVGSSIPGSFSQLSMGRTLNPKLLLTAVPTVCEWVDVDEDLNKYNLFTNIHLTFFICDDLKVLKKEEDPEYNLPSAHVRCHTHI